MLPPHHLAAADKKDLYANAHFRARQADGILIAGAGDDALLFRYAPHRLELIAQARRQFKLQRLRRSRHPRRKNPLDFLCPPF